MKYNTLIRYKMTAEYWDFTITGSDGVGNTQEFFFDSVIACNVVSAGDGRLFMHVNSPLRIGGRVNNIRDTAGQVYAGSLTGDVGYSYEITSVDPVVNVFGQRDSLRYTLIRL